MAKSVKLTNSEEVTQHIKKLDPEVAKIIQTLRKIILNADKEIGERIKWNNPSFYYAGEIKPFDPKEYKSEIIVFNLFKNRIMLVFQAVQNLMTKRACLKVIIKMEEELLYSRI
jgi:hypothetical protein